MDAMEREVELKTQQYLKDEAEFEKEVSIFEEIKQTIADLDKALERNPLPPGIDPGTSGRILLRRQRH